MSNEGQQFWKGFTNEDVDPYKQYEYGEKIAESIRKTYQTFKKIEDTLIQKDFKIYVWFAQIQLKIMNDLDGYQIFIQKMRGVMQMNKMFSGASSSLLKGKLMNEDSGFLVVDGHTATMGKMLFMNKTLRRNLQRDLDELKFTNISSLMPKLIAEKHDEFMRRYNQSGEAILLDKEMVTFFVDKGMQLFVVDLLIKFHYSQKFQYCFIAFTRNLKTMTPFRDSLKYKTDQLVFLTIDMFDGQIYEVSKNFSHLLELAGITHFRDSLEIVFQEKKRTVSDILRGFSFQDLIQLKKVRGNQRDFYEGTHQLDLSSFAESYDYFNQTLEEINAKVAIYVDSYGQGRLDMGYVVLSVVTNATSSNLNLDEKTEDFQFKDQQAIYEDQMNQQILQQESESGSVSGSGSGGSSSGSSASTSYHAMQQFHSFYRQETPRILKIVIQLIVFMFIVSITIATVNLVLNIKSHNTSELEVRQVRASMDRLNFSVSIRVLLRSLLNIANGYEPNQSSIIEDRFSTFLSLLQDKSNQMISTQYYLDNSGYSFSKNFSEELSKSQISLTYLQDNGKYKVENVTMRNMMSLYTSRLVQIQEFTKAQMKGNLYMQTLKPNTSDSYQPTSYEQTIFFIIYNGNRVVRQYNKMFADMYIRDSIANSESSEQQTLITTIVSILTIFFVTCVISPIVSKTEERKYNALVFFLKIPRHEVDFYIKSCQECEKLDGAQINNKNTYSLKNKPGPELGDFKSLDYASMVRYLKLFPEDFDKIIKLISFIQFQVYNDDSLYDPSSSELRHYESGALDNSQKRLMCSDVNSSLRSGITGSPSPLNLNKKKSLFGNNQLPSFVIQGNNINNIAEKYKSKSGQISQFSQKNSITGMQEDIQNQEEQAREIQKISLQNKILRGKTAAENGASKKIKAPSRSDSKSSHHSSSLPSMTNIFNNPNIAPKRLQDIEMKSEDQRQQEVANTIMNNNLKKITSIAFRKKTVTFLLVMILMIVFSVYFIISYFMSIQNYQAASNSSQDLGIIFSKEQCFENLISYIRENQISNRTISLQGESTSSASSYFLASCSSQESRFKSLRINMPEYFVGAQEYINSIETDQYCDVVFQTEEMYKDAPCKAAINGLLSKGMTNTLFYMLAQAQKMELSFNTALAVNGRSASFLTQLIGNKDTIELIDAKMYIMGKSFVELENQCMNSALAYFKKLLTDFEAVYAVFLALLITSMIYFTIFAFKRLRKSMWSTNMLLKIIPKHTLSKDDSDKLKQFFVT